MSTRLHVFLPLLLWAFVLTGCERMPTSAEPADSASPGRVRLLSGEQYANTIAAVFGRDVSDSVLPPLPPLARTEGLLASGASLVGLTSDQLSQIQLAAASIAARVVDEDHRTFLLPCAPEGSSGPDAECARMVLEAAGRLLQRRPMEAERLDALVEIAGEAARQTSDFHEGLALALEAILISPEFLFIVDRVGDAVAGGAPLDAYSLASRLSFFLWNGPPDDALLDAAASGALDTLGGLESEIDRMLASPRLEEGMRAFFDDMFAFDEFDALAKDPNVYPMVTGATLRDAREQTLRTVIDHVLDRDADYRDLFVTRRSFMSMQLAAVYGTPTGQGWVEHEFDARSQRMGLLTHVSFLAANSHPVRSSPTLRGKALRERFLCQEVPPPPPNVDFSLLEDAGDVATARERLSVHNTNPSCAGCHLITDPMGLSLENFDGAGRWRDTENGAELDISGELDGIFYDDIPGLAEAMRGHPKLSWCLVNRLYAYGTGGAVELRHDRPTLEYLEARFVEDDHRLRGILRTLALSRAFRMVRVEAGIGMDSTAVAGASSQFGAAGSDEEVMR